MGGYFASCILCGMPIDTEFEWMPIFRASLTPNLLLIVRPWLIISLAVYTDKNDRLNPKLSGVGARGYRSDRAPIDPALRYDTPGLDSASLIDIAFYESDIRVPSPAIPPATSESARGFPFHDACWTLLKALYYPDEINIRTLYDLCQSLPINAGHLDWGHGFNGLVKYCPDLSKAPLGEESSLTRRYILHEMPGSVERLLHSWDSLEVPSTEEIMNGDLSSSEDTHRKTGLGIRDSNSQGLFGSLPMEILDIILHHLPSRDVLNLKLASARFAIMPLRESFWKSRFQRGFEFHPLFEVRQYLRQGQSWAILYSKLKLKRIPTHPHYRNRSRIWSLLLRLYDLITNLPSLSLEGDASRSFFEPDAADDNLSWNFVGGDLKEPGRSFDKGCRVLWNRSVDVPCNIVNIFVSFIELTDVQYICGLRFQLLSGGNVCLGYINRKMETQMDADISALTKDDHELLYFYFAVAPRGLRAISLVKGTGKQDIKWTGNSKDALKTRLPIEDLNSMRLKAGFDRIKMVSLGVPYKDNCPTHTKHSNLRETAQWFPKIPDDSLCLNESSFLDVSSNSTQYLPLTTFIFGGENGKYLNKITAIAVWVVNAERIYGIDFIYDMEIDGREVHTLGYSGPYSDILGRGFAWANDTPTSQRVLFHIDGPNGEVIDRVEKQLESPAQMIGSFRIHTNRGRVATFPPDIVSEAPFSPVKVESTITGFYARLESTNVIRSLGVISEQIPSTNDQNHT